MAFTQTLSAKAVDFATSTEGHHLPPSGLLDYVITGLGAVIVAYIIYVTVDRFLHPRETAPDHIKRCILEDRG